jgi:hypothetical protein
MPSVVPPDPMSGASGKPIHREREAIPLFLDFDGVLHPQDSEDKDLFCKVPLLHDVLRQYPQVGIVVSSSWRETTPYAELRQLLGPIGTLVMGRTPTRVRNYQLPDHVWSFVREAECWAWMRDHHRPPGFPWLALDDQRWRFSPSCPHVYFVRPDTGLVEADIAPLQASLNTLVAQHNS